MLKHVQPLFLLIGLLFLVGCLPESNEAQPEPTFPTDVPALKTRPTEDPTPMPEPTLEPEITTEPSPDSSSDDETESSSEAVTSSTSPAEVDLSQVTSQPPEETTPQVMPQPGVPDPGAAIAHQVSQDLAVRLGVDVDDVQTISVEEVEWSDSALGCPAPGMMYLTVITPGYLVTLDLSDIQYNYHADQHGNYVLCGDDGQPVTS